MLKELLWLQIVALLTYITVFLLYFIFTLLVIYKKVNLNTSIIILIIGGQFYYYILQQLIKI